MKTLLGVIFIFLVLLGGSWAVYWKWSSDMRQENISAALIDFTFEKPNFVVTGKGLTAVDIIGVPTGTGITEADYVVLGKASLQSTDSTGVQRWVVEAPSREMLLTEIMAKASHDNAPVATKSLPYKGASEIAQALWGQSENQSFTMTWVDGGKTFVFNVGSRFGLELAEKQYPQKNLTCGTAGVIGKIANEPESQGADTYHLNFETIKKGECTLKTGDFSAVIVVVDDISKTLMYTNTKEGFSITYRASSVLADSQREIVTGTSKARIALSRNDFIGTNLSEAFVAVGTAQNKSTLSSCIKAQEGESDAGTVDIGGVTFSIFEQTGAAAGNRYETRSYRAVRQNTCYEIQELVHYGVLENYEPGAVRNYDASLVRSELEKIAHSFVFLKR